MIPGSYGRSALRGLGTELECAEDERGNGPMAERPTTPMSILITALAYMIEADMKTVVEEKAKLVTLLRKHVSRGHMTDGDLQREIDSAFEYIHRTGVDKFLLESTPVLTMAQRIAVVMNLYDTILVDGLVAEGEVSMMRKFRTAYGISDSALSLMRELVMFKNDTNLFINPNHPRNTDDFDIDLSMERWLRGEKSI